ncbi:MAG: recombination mediator RecR [Minisyncoccia bacterium]
MELSKNFKKITEILSSLPGLGPRQSLRLAFYLLKKNENFKKSFLENFSEFFSKIKLCQKCYFPYEPKIEEDKLCEICRDKTRDHSIICVVEKETDLLTIEKTKKFKGVYFILGGLLKDLDKNKIRELRINTLIQRLKEDKPKPKEVILAFSPTSEGNFTSYYLEKLFKNSKINIKISRPATGLPFGGEIEFADTETLIKALEGRK